MSEDVLGTLKKQREESEKAYIKFKGMLEGIRRTNLSPAEESILKIVELMVGGFKSSGDSIKLLFEAIYHLHQRIENLEKEVKQLQKRVDTFQENK